MDLRERAKEYIKLRLISMNVSESIAEWVWSYYENNKFELLEKMPFEVVWKTLDIDQWIAIGRLVQEYLNWEKNHVNRRTPESDYQSNTR